MIYRIGISGRGLNDAGAATWFDTSHSRIAAHLSEFETAPRCLWRASSSAFSSAGIVSGQPISASEKAGSASKTMCGQRASADVIGIASVKRRSSSYGMEWGQWDIWRRYASRACPFKRCREGVVRARTTPVSQSRPRQSAGAAGAEVRPRPYHGRTAVGAALNTVRTGGAWRTN